jgi:hypothetical protein
MLPFFLSDASLSANASFFSNAMIIALTGAQASKRRKKKKEGVSSRKRLQAGVLRRLPPGRADCTAPAWMMGYPTD